MMQAQRERYVQLRRTLMATLAVHADERVKLSDRLTASTKRVVELRQRAAASERGLAQAEQQAESLVTALAEKTSTQLPRTMWRPPGLSPGRFSPHKAASPAAAPADTTPGPAPVTPAPPAAPRDAAAVATPRQQPTEAAGAASSARRARPDPEARIQEARARRAAQLQASAGKKTPNRATPRK